MATRDFPFACVVFAEQAGDAQRASVAAMVESALALGAAPVVTVLARGSDALPGARVAHVAAGAPRISAIRAGMTLLANSAVEYALLWPHGAEADLASLRALVDDARDQRATLTALAGADLDHAPVMIARDAWLELLTLGEQGLGAVAARRGERRVAN
jgi:hypothetical protein